MTDKIKTGAILIAGDTFLPQSALFESEPYANGWKLVRNIDGRGLNQVITGAGWNFLCIADQITVSVFGADEEKTTRQAVRKVIAQMVSKDFNCVEITRMGRKRFLGLPYLNVSARSRHIQKGIVLFESRMIARGTEAAQSASEAKREACEG
jgi:hypothetical protein